MSTERTDLARRSYRAYETGDRDAMEVLVADDFAFWSPQDDGIDRAAYFEHCWRAALDRAENASERAFLVERLAAAGA